MRNHVQDDAVKNFVKVAKRIAITILCCVPVMIVFGYLTRNVITSNFAQSAIFFVFMSVVVAVIEIVARKKEKQQKEEIETKKDVFK